jgi:putative spermidine/putrescine transport system permease protein
LLISSIAWLVLALLTLPLLILVSASFSTSDYVRFPPQGFTLEWYGRFFSDPLFLNSLILSAEIATLSSLLATVLGFPAAYVLIRRRFPGREFVSSLLLSPILVPQIILGVALLQYFTFLGLANSFSGLLVAHSVSVLPYVIRTVGASLSTIDPRVEEAASDLGAGKFLLLPLVVAPMVRGGLVAGALFAFIMSWVNVEVSIFLGVTGSYTLPVVIFNFMEYSITTVVMAAAAVAVYVAVILVVIIDRIAGIHTASKL